MFKKTHQLSIILFDFCLGCEMWYTKYPVWIFPFLHCSILVITLSVDLLSLGGNCEQTRRFLTSTWTNQSGDDATYRCRCYVLPTGEINRIYCSDWGSTELLTVSGPFLCDKQHREELLLLAVAEVEVVGGAKGTSKDWPVKRTAVHCHRHGQTSGTDGNTMNEDALDSANEPG